MTLSRVPSVTAAGQPAALAPGEESPGVSLVPALFHHAVFTLEKQTKKTLPPPPQIPLASGTNLCWGP